MAESRNILLLSHGILSSTGFGRVIHQIALGLRDDGHKIFIPNREYHGKPLQFNDVESLHGEDYRDMTILGFGNDQFGSDVIPRYIQDFDIDIVITLGDIWCYQYIKEIPNYGKWRWIAYYALDTNNMVAFWLDHIRGFDIPVVMSEFGQILCGEFKLDVKHIPHAVDTTVFRPVADKKERSRLRTKMRIPHDAFVVGCVAHNHGRKMLDKTLDAFALFAQDKENVYLVMHTQPTGSGAAGGWNFEPILKSYGLEDKVRFTNYNSKGIGDTIVSDEIMRDLYCTFDVHMLLTGGEGFGIPFIESMACAIPNITTKYTTGPELIAGVPSILPGEEIVGKAGVLVPVDTFNSHQTGGRWALANVEYAASALDAMYNDEKLGQKMGKVGRKMVLDKYTIGRIQKMWCDLVSSVNIDKTRKVAFKYPFGAYTIAEMVAKGAEFQSLQRTNDG